MAKIQIGGYNIGTNGVYNIAKHTQALETARLTANRQVKEDFKKKAQKAMSKVSRQMLTRQAAAINRWQAARMTAESEIMPNNTELIRIYKDLEIDAHLWALTQTLRLKVMANAFAVYNENDEIDQEATDLFTKKWFREIQVAVVDADLYGFSLVQLGDIVNGCFIESDVVPREYVVQQKGGVKKNLGNANDLIDFNSGSFKNWLVPIGNTRNLGILDKAAPLVIKKKEVISAWSEAAELFGMPMRIGRTQIQDPEKRENMEDMLDKMGEAAWGVFDKEDEIELIQTSKTDFSNLYDSFIDRMNSELSKLVLLQTGTTDEKSFVGSAQVHQNILQDVIESYILKVEDVANETVLPICERHGLIKMGCYLKANNEQKLPPAEMLKIITELLKNYNIPADWINETFDVPVEDKEVPETLDPNNSNPTDPKKPTPNPEDNPDEDDNPLLDAKASASSVMKAMQELYAGVIVTKIEDNE